MLTTTLPFTRRPAFASVTLASAPTAKKKRSKREQVLTEADKENASEELQRPKKRSLRWKELSKEQREQLAKATAQEMTPEERDRWLQLAMDRDLRREKVVFEGKQVPSLSIASPFLFVDAALCFAWASMSTLQALSSCHVNASVPSDSPVELCGGMHLLLG